MRGTGKRFAMAGLLFSGLSLGAYAQDVVYVKTATAEIREGTSFNGPVIAEVERGTALQVESVERRRYLVVAPNGKKGFVSQLKVTNEPPDDGDGLGTFIRDEGVLAERSVVVSGRGLSPTNKKLADDGNISEEAQEDVDETETLAKSISESEVESFLSEGGLNP